MNDKDLRGRREFLEAIISSLPGTFYVLDQDGNHVIWNKNAETIFGYSPEELTSTNSLEFIAEHERDRVKEAIECAFREGRSSIRTEAITKDGRIIPFYFSAISTVINSKTYLVGTGIEISQQVEVEESLRKSEQKYRDLVENTIDILFSADEEGVIQYVSPRVAKYGYTPDDFLGKNFLQIVEPEDQESAIRDFMRMIETGREFPSEIRIRDAEEHVHWFESIAKLRKDNAGNLLGVNGILRDIDERKKAELALKESEEMFRFIFEGAIDGILLADPDTGKFHMANPSICSMLGYSEEELLAMGVDDIHPADALQQVHEALKKQISGDEPLAQDLPVLLKDGRVIICDIGSSIVQLKGRQFVMGFFRDNTDRTYALEALRHSEEKYSKLVESSMDGIVIHQNAVIKFVNRAGLGMLGYSEEEIIEHNILDFIAPEHRELVFQRYQDRAKGKDVPSQYEIDLKKKDGSHIPVELSVNVTHYQGVPSAMVFLRDISERRIAEEKIRESERLFRELYEDAPNAYCSINAFNGSFLNFNKAALDMLGYDPGELSQLKVLDVYSDTPDGVPTAKKLFRLLKQGKPIENAELQMKRKDGDYRWINLNVKPVFNEEGVVVESRSVAQDITERKMAEKALREKEEQLREAQKMEAVGQLAGGVAHEFNNMMGAIKGYCDLLVEDVGVDDPKYADIQGIRQVADRVAELTRKLLAFGRRQIMQPRVIDLQEQLGGMMSLVRRIAGENVRIVIESDNELKGVKADPGQFEHVVMNLVMNAKEAMPSGGELRIELRNHILDEGRAAEFENLKPGGYVMLAVHDTGSGMDAGTLSRIFEPFFTTKDKSRTTGLGLPTIHGIVRQTGGDIRVESERGKGSVFRIFLPASEEPVEKTHSSRPDPRQHGSGMTCLVVEDESIMLKVISRMLDSRGFNVIEAKSGKEALRKVGEHEGPISILVTDVVMPEMSGKELADTLSPRMPGMKVLFITGHTDNAIVEQGILKEGTMLLRKPFAVDELMKKVMEVLGS